MTHAVSFDCRFLCVKWQILDGIRRLETLVVLKQKSNNLLLLWKFRILVVDIFCNCSFCVELKQTLCSIILIFRVGDFDKKYHLWTEFWTWNKKRETSLFAAEAECTSQERRQGFRPYVSSKSNNSKQQQQSLYMYISISGKFNLGAFCIILLGVS